MYVIAAKRGNEWEVISGPFETQLIAEERARTIAISSSSREIFVFSLTSKVKFQSCPAVQETRY